jgi:CheY-like chemotaxis protein
MNLVVNARDAMPQGGRLIIQIANLELNQNYAHQTPEIKAGSYVLLTVSDTGCGMDETTQARIFEPFFTTKEVGQGTGLGLATVHGIINQSGGYIQVFSEPGKGTTFKIYLPRIEQEEPAYPAQKPAEAQRGSETVLLVEDEVMVRNLIRRVLLEGGYRVLEANHGVEALQICERYSQPIHLLITDMVMPGGINGRQLVERLLAVRPELKVLYISGYPDQTLARHDFSELQTGFLSKPFRPETLMHKLQEALTAAQ